MQARYVPFNDVDTVSRCYHHELKIEFLKELEGVFTVSGIALAEGLIEDDESEGTLLQIIGVIEVELVSNGCGKNCVSELCLLTS